MGTKVGRGHRLGWVGEQGTATLPKTQLLNGDFQLLLSGLLFKLYNLPHRISLLEY